MRRARWRRARSGHRGVAQVLGAVMLVLITIVLMVVVYLIRYPLPNPPPSVGWASVNDQKFPAWGDPTDCYPNLPHNWQYYLANGTGNTTDQNRYNTYMDAWNTDCENADNGTYNLMNATQIFITQVSKPIPLADIEFEFICTNTTPAETTVLVQGMLSDMEWVPGGSQNLSSSAPTLGTCINYDPRGSGANSVYYNRLGFFDPLNTQTPELLPGMSIVIYEHTQNSILEAPNPLEPESAWGIADADDYHGAPFWCYTSPGSCTIELIDTDWTYPVVIMSAPVFEL